MFLLAAISASLTLSTSTAEADHPKPKKHAAYEIKTAFIYNFTKFIEWPEGTFTEANPNYVVCVIGEDRFGNSLDLLKNKTSKGKSFNVVRIPELSGNNSLDIERCDILYISPSTRRTLPEIIDRLKNSNTLTISDMDGFAKMGGVIGFVERDNKIGLQINTGAAKKMDLKISSRLLKLVDIIRE